MNNFKDKVIFFALLFTGCLLHQGRKIQKSRALPKKELLDNEHPTNK